MDPADAYVELYDLLVGCSGSVVCDWWMEQDTAAIGERVRHDVLTQGELPDHWMTRPLPNRNEPNDQARLKEYLGILRGLDDALRSVSDETDVSRKRSAYDIPATPYDELRYLRYRIDFEGRLNHASAGYLVFRRGRDCRPTTTAQTLADLLSLIRIPPHVSSRVLLHPVVPAKDLPDLEPVDSVDPDQPPFVPIPVAQLPMLAESEDLLWEAIDHNPARFYTVAPNTARLRERLVNALSALDDSDSVLALLPEACVDDDLVREWQRVLRDNPAPSRSRLAWLLIGTGPFSHGSVGITGRRPNRAVLMNRSGAILLTQDKHHGFTFTAKQQQDYGITTLGGATRDEYIDLGTEFKLLESRYGRFGINICEDLARHDLQSDVIACGVTHLMVPVLAASIFKAGWQAKAAQTLVIEAGTSVAVTNGLAIDRYVPAMYGGGPAPTLVTIRRPIGHPTEYPRPADMVQECACRKTGISAVEDALTPRTVDW